MLLDMEDYEKTNASLKLMADLAKGMEAGEEQGWETIEKDQVIWAREFISK